MNYNVVNTIGLNEPVSIRDVITVDIPIDHHEIDPLFIDLAEIDLRFGLARLVGDITITRVEGHRPIDNVYLYDFTVIRIGFKFPLTDTIGVWEQIKQLIRDTNIKHLLGCDDIFVDRSTVSVLDFDAKHPDHQKWHAQKIRVFPDFSKPPEVH